MGLARDYAKEKEDKALVYVGFMRLHIMQKDKGWMREVEKNFSEARSIISDLPGAFYYRGIAYKHSYRFADSGKLFKRVLEINKALAIEAEQQLRLIQKIERAMPETEIGKRAVIMDRITRAYLAALFVQEMRLEQMYEKAGSSAPDLPPDVQNHSLKKDIETILRLDIQGLKPFSDGAFGPDDYVTRAGYAIMIADIIAKIENDHSLTARYVGSASPFKDVRSDARYFGAAMVCTTRGGIMEAKNGFFRPMDSLSGADALCIMRKLQQELRAD
jgi:hypothetical protein